ncbi:UNVERIFIED_CONTAM: hypothetical protein Sradi_5350100 [Sesamum radiatum]|uniref:Uncharacterized protein n=1 Tax=Sesamum radiatum TaxID=300843 RepID=A0AAW2LRU5_SESRA
MNLFLVNCEEFTRPKNPPGLPNVWLLGDRKNVSPSPNDAGLMLSMEKANLVEKEAVTLVSGSKNAIG